MDSSSTGQRLDDSVVVTRQNHTVAWCNSSSVGRSWNVSCAPFLELDHVTGATQHATAWAGQAVAVADSTCPKHSLGWIRAYVAISAIILVISGLWHHRTRPQPAYYLDSWVVMYAVASLMTGALLVALLVVCQSGS